MTELSAYFADVNRIPIMPWPECFRHLKCLHRLRQEIKCRARVRNSWLREANLKTIAGIRDLVCEGNLRLVVSCAKTYPNPGMMPDLIAEGNLGLLSAIDDFDIYRGFRFSTYASCVIKTWMRNLVNSQSLVFKKGSNQRIGVFVKAQRALSTAGNYAPSDQEITDWLNMNGPKSSRGKWKPKHIALLRANKELQSHYSLDGPAGDGTLGETIPDREPSSGTQADFNTVMKCLKRHADARDMEVVCRRFLHKALLKEIGADYGVTRERVRQIETSTLERVRTVFRCRRDSWVPLQNLVRPGEKLATRAAIAHWLSHPDPPLVARPLGAALGIGDPPAVVYENSLPMPDEC